MDKKIIFVGLASLLLVLVATLAVYWFGQSASFRGTSYGEPFPVAASFELTRADGEIFRLSDQRGKIVLLFFGYTACPDVCPTTMGEMKQVVDALGDKAEAVQVVFVSVDPDRDTSQSMQKYVEHFNHDFIGLSGSMDELSPIWDAYGIVRTVNQTSASAMGYIIDHTARVFLVDANGNLRLSYGFQTPVEDIVHDIKILLR